MEPNSFRLVPVLVHHSEKRRDATDGRTDDRPRAREDGGGGRQIESNRSNRTRRTFSLARFSRALLCPSFTLALCASLRRASLHAMSPRYASGSAASSSSSHDVGADADVAFGQSLARCPGA